LPARAAHPIFYFQNEGNCPVSENKKPEDQLEIRNEDNAQPPADPASTEDAKSAKAKRPVSEARLRANRENAKKSTGPRTTEGKQRSSLNATRHSILAQVIHLPKEDMAAYNKFTSDYVAP
jgi:hypothetical protein